MTHAIINGLQFHSFHEFFECWIVEQNQQLGELVSASREHDIEVRDGLTDERTLRPLLSRVVHHYEHYYRAKSWWANDDILSMFNPSWRSSLEDAFLWVGGWRPSIAFHLLYSKSGLQLEAGLESLLQGEKIGDLGDLSANQMGKVDELQKKIIREEKLITEKLAKQQEKVADSSMVELAHSMTEGGMEQDDSRVKATLIPKEEGLLEVLQKADDLRLKTLKEVLNIFTPIQSVHFLIAAAELHLRVHEWGEKRDAMNRQAEEEKT